MEENNDEILRWYDGMTKELNVLSVDKKGETREGVIRWERKEGGGK